MVKFCEDCITPGNCAVSNDCLWILPPRRQLQSSINAATHGSAPAPAWAVAKEKAADFNKPLTLPKDHKARKALPICTGVLDYFPLALAEIAKLSKIGNDKHNPGMPLHWSRGKSNDHADCLVRHQAQRGTIDEDTITEEFPEGLLHEVAVAWRALAQLQIAIEQRRKPGDAT